MANPSKNRGTAFETAVVRYLRDHGFPKAERRALAGLADLGDVLGVRGVTIECKDVGKIHLPSIVDEAIAEADHCEAADGGPHVPLSIIKRRGRNVADAYAVLPLAYVVDLLWIVDGLRSDR